MYLKIITILSLALLLFFSSCDSDNGGNENSAKLEGVFSGVFTVEYTNGETISNPVTVTFTNGQYTSSTGLNRFPAGGNGAFEFGNNTIEFSDENIWTADFDWNLILNGSYEYSLNEDQLHFSASKNDVGIYEYILIKE